MERSHRANTCGNCQGGFVPWHGDSTGRYCGSCIRNYYGNTHDTRQLSRGEQQFASDRIDSVLIDLAGRRARADKRAELSAARVAEKVALQRDQDAARDAHARSDAAWLRDTARELGGGSL